MSEKKSKKLVVLILVLLMGVSFLVVSCGLNQETAEDDTDATLPSDKHGGNLIFSLQTTQEFVGYPPEMYALSAVPMSLPSLQTLIGLDTSGNYTPLLARDWEITNEGLTYTFHLQEDVKFHDGTDFNAEAVKWNLENYTAEGREELHGIESIDVIDDITLRLNLSEPNSLILTFLTAMPGLMISPTAFEIHGKDWLIRNPVGTGPFEFVSAEPDVSVKFKRFDDYWEEGKPYLDTLEFQFVADKVVQITAFEAGNYDVIFPVEPFDASRLIATGKYILSEQETDSTVHGLIMDGGNPNSPFYDIKVRRAVEHAINREALNEALGYGYWTITNQIAWPGLDYYNPDVIGYAYDPDKSRQLLEEAGYSNGFDTTIMLSVGHRWQSDYAVLLQEMLLDVGINVTIDIMSPELYWSRISPEGGWDNGITVIPLAVSPPDSLYSIARAFGPSNLFPSKHNPESFQQKLEQALGAASYEEKIQLTHELHKLMVDEYAMAIWTHMSGDQSAEHIYVKDMNFVRNRSHHWTPQDAWLDK